MISSQLLRELARDGPDRILVDTAGVPYQVERLPDDAIPPALVVAKVTEAVKEIEGERVVGYLNRDAMWVVEGFLLSGDVVSILPDGVDSAASLIEAVTRAGFQWSAALPAPPLELE